MGMSTGCYKIATDKENRKLGVCKEWSACLLLCAHQLCILAYHIFKISIATRMFLYSNACPYIKMVYMYISNIIGKIILCRSTGLHFFVAHKKAIYLLSTARNVCSCSWTLLSYQYQIIVLTLVIWIDMAYLCCYALIGWGFCLVHRC